MDLRNLIWGWEKNNFQKIKLIDDEIVSENRQGSGGARL